MILTIIHKRHFFEPPLPYFVFIDGLYAGTIRNKEMVLDVPAGSYSLKVQFGAPIRIGKRGKVIDLSLSSTQQLKIDKTTTVRFHDREWLWNILFDIDLLAWLVSMFVDFPSVYKTISNLFFVVWIIRLIIIRKKYYRFTIES